MSDLLDRLREGRAFDGTPRAEDLPVYHVPFDDEGRNGAESGVIEAARVGERIGVVGPIGCGKTSLLRYALDNPEEPLAPIWVSVAFDDDQVILDVRRFAEHLSQSIVRDAERAGRIAPAERDTILAAATERRPLPGKERKVGARLAAKFWIASSELSGEVASTLAGMDLKRPAKEILANVNRALDAIRAHDRAPVLVVDDSDSFTRRQGSESTRDQRVEGFFGPILRAITDLEAGVIVGVHNQYLDMDAFAKARRDYGSLERLVEVPEIRSRQMERILDRRVRVAGGGTRSDALTDEAIERLAELNRARTNRNLRTLLTVANSALVSALDRGAARIDARDVDRAAVAVIGP